LREVVARPWAENDGAAAAGGGTQVREMFNFAFDK
jgi:hypothetical protein